MARENPRIDRDEWWMNAVLNLSERRDSLIFSSLLRSGAMQHENWGYKASDADQKLFVELE